MRRDRAVREQGFSLIEVMVAIVLLTVAILGAATMQITALGGRDVAIRTTNASTMASDTMEDLIGRDYNDSLLAPTVFSSPSSDASYNSAMSNTGAAHVGPVTHGFEVFWNVIEDYPIDNTKAIRVIVRRGDRGVTRTVSLDYIKMGP